MMMTEAYEESVFREGYRRGKEETTTELMAWHDRVCEEMAKRHTADRPKGEWIDEHEDGHGSWVGTCSQCHKIEKVTNFCPNCGARMKGADDE